MYLSCIAQPRDQVGFSVIPAGSPFAARCAFNTAIARRAVDAPAEELASNSAAHAIAAKRTQSAR
jgi:hypothetical protein